MSKNSKGIKKGNSIKLVLGSAGVVVVLALVIGFSAFQYMRYRDLAQRLPENAVPIKIAILDPAPGAQSPAGTPLLVTATAFGEKPLLSLELWANGVVVGVQAAPSGGIKPMKASFGWTPSEPGNYSLIARAIDTDKRTADSATVLVLIGMSKKGADSKKSEDPSKALQIANGGGGEGLPPAQTAAIPLPPLTAPPNSGDSIGASSPWQGSLGDWVSQVMVTSPPAEPQLTAAPNGCGVKLSIHDLSSDEDGFFVYRQLPNASQWERVVTLGAQSKFKWLTYTDSGHSGLLNYYVAAFNNAGEAAGNLATVKVDPAACPTSISMAPVLSIALTSLKTDLGADRAYCYKSLNGIYWSRWPTDGFFTPGADGFDVKNQGDSTLLNEPDKALTLDLECWGWNDGKIQMLGKFRKEGIHARKLENIHLEEKGLAIDLDLGLTDQITAKGHTPDHPPTDPKMPPVLALMFFGVDACREHTPSKGASLGENFAYCYWYPEYNTDNGASQPYLVWFVTDGSCAAGQGAACNTFDWYVQQAKANGGKVGFHVYGQISDALPLATTKHDLTAWVLPPQSECGQGLHLRVRMFYEGGPNDPNYPNQLVEAPDSNTIHYTFNCPPPSEVQLDVFFDTLHIGDLGDGVGGGDDLELYGSIVAEGIPGTGSVLNLGKWGGSSGNCPDDSFEWAGPKIWYGPAGTLGFTPPVPALPLDQTGLGYDADCQQAVQEGDSNFSLFQLCRSDTYKHCLGDFKRNNNRIRVTVGDGSRIRVSVHLVDYDELPGDDNACQAETWVGPESIFGWQGFSGSGYLSQGDNDTASCKVYFHISPVSP